MARREYFQRQIRWRNELLRQQQNIFWRLLGHLTDRLTAPRVAALLLGVFGVLIGFGGYANQYCYSDFCNSLPNLGEGWGHFFKDFYANVATTLIGIAIAVLTIDWLGERRVEHLAEEQLKAQLIREMGSTDNGIALRAVRELRAREWLEDGSLEWADLDKANLRGADLHMAYLQIARLGRSNLQGANLHGANLEGAFLYDTDLRGAELYGAVLYDADLHRADLRGANLSLVHLSDADRQLSTAYRLRDALMPSGIYHYDGCYNLLGDIADAIKQGIDTKDPTAMADFYGVSLEEYQRGQKWARENPPRPRSKAEQASLAGLLGVDHEHIFGEFRDARGLRWRK
ncbi:MAG: pentapeptide repeat-containing protein [Roseiflexaceae bacterium]